MWRRWWAGSLEPRLARAINDQRRVIDAAEGEGFVGISIGPAVPMLLGKDRRHAIVYLGHLLAPVDHDHRVAVTPLSGRPPDARDREDLLIGEGVPGARHGALGALGFRPGCDWDQAPPLAEAVYPEAGVQLVLAGVVHGLGLKRRAGLLALEDEGEAPVHRADHAVCDHEAGIAGVDLGSEIRRCVRGRSEQPCDGGGGRCHPIEIAHAGILRLASHAVNPMWRGEPPSRSSNNIAHRRHDAAPPQSALNPPPRPRTFRVGFDAHWQRRKNGGLPRPGGDENRPGADAL